MSTTTPATVVGTSTIPRALVLPVYPATVAATAAVPTPFVAVQPTKPATVAGVAAIAQPSVLIPARVVAGVAAIPQARVAPAQASTVTGVASVGPHIFTHYAGPIAGVAAVPPATITDDHHGATATIVGPVGTAPVGFSLTLRLDAYNGAAAPLDWQVATDATFTTLVASGTTQTLSPGETVTVPVPGLDPGVTYWIRARVDPWTWQATSVTTSTNQGDAVLYLYGTVDTSTPVPHVWRVDPSGSTLAIVGCGFGNPQAQYTGTAWGRVNGGDFSLTVDSWTRVAATGNATTADRAITPTVLDPEHDVVVVDTPDTCGDALLGVYIKVVP